MKISEKNTKVFIGKYFFEKKVSKNLPPLGINQCIGSINEVKRVYTLKIYEKIKLVTLKLNIIELKVVKMMLK